MFFRKKQETEEYTVWVNELSEWYEQQLTPKKQRLKQKIKQTKQKVIQTTQETRQKINELEKAELMNPNIPERAKHFLTGNREAYIKKINSFLDAMALPEEIEELDGFFQDFNIQIQNLAQGIARPVQILNEFLSNETRAVSIPLGKIEKNIEGLKETIKNLKTDQEQETKQKIQELQNKIMQEKELKEELNSTIKETNLLKRENEQLMQETDLLKKDKELNQAKEKQKQTQEKINQMQKELLESFSIIETALKKYEHITFKHKEITTKYLESPIEALMNDLHLDVMHMLADLKTSAESEKLEMKPRKTKKTIEEIKKLTKERLGCFLTEYGQLHIEERKIQETISQMDTVIVAKEKEKKKEKNLEKLNGKMSRMNSLKTELSKIDIDLLTKELENYLSEQCSLKLTISAIPLSQEDPGP